MIKKVGSQYALYSRASHKRLGTFKSKAAALVREKQVNFFKYKSAHPEKFAHSTKTLKGRAASTSKPFKKCEKRTLKGGYN